MMPTLPFGDAPLSLPIDPFEPDYASARKTFLDRAKAIGAELATYENPNRGPTGEALATDCAWVGAKDARNVLVLVSATHGVEGFCGSGAQVDWLTNSSAGRPADTAVLLVHAINPYGFAWLRRTTEEGVDLNRNCIDFSKPLPENRGYIELADALVPHAMDAQTLAAADARCTAFRKEHGERAFETARSTGQHTHPNGLYYGGVEPAWSQRTLRRICRDFHLADRDGVAVIDFHTGLGPHGYGEPIVGHRPGESGQARCRAWYGESLGEPLLGTSSSLPIAGLTQYAWAEEIGADRLTFIALEFGTYPKDDGIRAMREEHRLHAHGRVDWNDPETLRIKHALRRHFHPATRAWKEMVLMRSRQVIDQALAGLDNLPIAA